MKTSGYLLAIFLVLFTTCKKKEIVVPDCIKSLVGTFWFCQNSGAVGQYLFQGKIVYVFDPGTCGADMQEGVFNEDCECIGALGGIIGNATINGVTFFENAKLLKVIWSDGSFKTDL
jgi:hypothetical protein